MDKRTESDVIHTVPHSPSTGHMGFLDGMRGVAALYVLLFHVYEWFYFGHGTALSLPVRLATRWMGYGHYAVAVFIVLSGFCLMLPVASPSNTSQRLRGGAGEYLRRRAKRILPPYYAALILCLILVFGMQGIRQLLHGHLPLSKGDVLSHFLLLHNLHKEWNMGIDPPLWSVATEWQIYFMLPLLLLPVWRRFGIFASVVVAFLVGLAPHFLLPSAWNYDWACPWYLGLFALGMLGAVIANATSGRLRSLYLRTPWTALTLLCTALFGTLLVTQPGNLDYGTIAWGQTWMLDAWIGLTTLCLILACTLRKRADIAKSDASVLFLSLLESRVAMGLGAFSYSIYLLHQPLYEKILIYLNRSSLSSDALWFLILTIVVPLLLLACYLFHLAFERPWMRSGTRTNSKAL